MNNLLSLSRKSNSVEFPFDEMSDMIDRITSRYSSPPWQQDIILSRREYDAIRGEVYDDEETFTKVIFCDP